MEKKIENRQNDTIKMVHVLNTNLRGSPVSFESFVPAYDVVIERVEYDSCFSCNALSQRVR